MPIWAHDVEFLVQSGFYSESRSSHDGRPVLYFILARGSDRLSDLASTRFMSAALRSRRLGTRPMVRARRHAFQLCRAVYLHGELLHVCPGWGLRSRSGCLGTNDGEVSVSALVVDYILTGPISVVSAGQYLGRLLNEISELLHQLLPCQSKLFRRFLGL